MQISWRATIPSQYFWGLFTFPSLRNSFWGALPPTVGQSFLLAASSLPDVDGPASAAIWANYWVGDDSGDLPASPSLSASLILCVSSSWVGFVPPVELGSPLVLGVPMTPPAPTPSFLLVGLFYPPPFMASSLFWPCWKLDRESQPIRSQSSLVRVVWQPFEFLICITLVYDSFSLYWLSQKKDTKLSDEWARYKKILEREDEEFKKAVEVEVSTLLFSRFSSKCKNFVWGIYYRSIFNGFCHFQVMLSSLSMIGMTLTCFQFTLGTRSEHFGIWGCAASVWERRRALSRKGMPCLILQKHGL